MGKLIVCAEDEKELRELLEDTLRDAGFDVISAANGRECLRLLARYTPHLILLDMNMPEVNGLDVLTNISSDERLKNIPVVMLSAHGVGDCVKKAIELGAVDYVVKPFDFANLARRLSGHLFDGSKLRSILTGVTEPDGGFFKNTSPDYFFKSYQVKVGEKTLAILTSRGVALKEAYSSRQSMERFVKVFEKTSDSWRLVWPGGGADPSNMREILSVAAKASKSA